MQKAKTVVNAGAHHLLIDERANSDAPIEIGSSAWFEWLTRNKSFSFSGRSGRFSASKERVRENGWYWKAYRWHNGRRHVLYLGRSEDLSAERFEEVASAIAKKCVPEDSVGAVRRVPRAPRPRSFVPALRPGHIVRQRLLQRLRSGIHLPVTVVAAPAGYGKTSLVAEWVRTDKRHSAWMSLNARDNSSALFWETFGEALGTLQAGTADNIRADLSSLQQQPNALAIMANVISDLSARSTERAAGQPQVLVIDDLHELAEPGPVQALIYFAEHLPANLRLVIITRQESMLPLARWRVQHRVSEVRAADLAFNDIEARAFLNDVMGLRLDSDAVSLLKKRSEGWVAALQLAALSLQNNVDPAAFIGQFRGSQQHMMEYLVDQVLVRLPKPVLDYITRASVLDRMCDDLCRALLDEPASTQAPTLHELEQANLFVIALDEDRRWYRFHQLFADLLRARLDEDHPGLARSLHTRAAQWYEDAGDLQASIQQAMLARDFERVARLAEADIVETWSHRDVLAPSAVWIDQLPDRHIRWRPTLILARVTTLLRQLQISAASDWLDHLDLALAAAPESEDMQIARARACVLRGYTLRMQQADSALVLEASERALTLLSKHDPIWRIHALLTHGALVFASANEPWRAYECFLEASELALQHDNREMHLGCQMLGALILCHGGQMRRAETSLAKVQRLIKAWGLPEATARNWHENVRMKLDYEHNDLQALEAIAQPLLDRAIAGTDHISIVNAATYLFRVHRARGAHDAALRVIDAAEPVCATSPFSRYYVTILRAFHLAAASDFALLEEWVEETTLRQKSMIWRMPGVHDDIRPWLARAHVLLGQPDQACGVLDPYIEVLARTKSNDALIRSLAIRALAHEQAGSRAIALEDLRNALALGKPEGYLRTFLDEGSAMLNLLLAARARNIEPAYVMKLISAFDTGKATAVERGAGAVLPPERVAPWLESLSVRERQVLTLLAAGHTNQSIAASLGISLTTVKSHTGAIFAKLGVKNRTQATARARELGLLS